ncbi:MAG: tetratricopeptide repeat protein [Actinobacteria bacterium]|nr:tetratricopeptide repeat protein [Actinomycetota bacterium]
MEEYIKAAALDSNNADYIASQGLIDAKKHLDHEAEQFFTKALEKDALNARALLGMGLVRGDQQRTKEAIEFLEKAIERDPSSARAHYALAVNYYFDGQIDEAWNQVVQAENLGMIVKQQFLDELEKAKKQ